MTRKLYDRFILAIAGLGLVMLGFIAGTMVIASLALDQDTSRTVAQLSISTQPVALTELERINAEVYERVSPSVVAINVASNFESGSGSGFVIDREGHIVTNYHVIQNARDIVVNFYDGTITRAEIVGNDPDSDLAVIRVRLDPERLIPATFGSSADLVIGQNVLAIGSPFGQRWTMTGGIISALDRSISGFNPGFSTGGVIQTDAPINPGNSGGPLLNLRGEVIGVNSQIRSETRSNSGIGFAIPSDLVARVARELIENQRVDYSYIGIRGGSVDLAAMEDLNLPNNLRGVLVSEVIRQGPAGQAGLLNPRLRETPGGRVQLVSADIITAINGDSLHGMDTLIAYLAAHTRPGDVVTLSVLRVNPDGTRETVELPLTLASRPSAPVR